MELARIILFVADIDAMERFYRDRVGLVAAPSADDDVGFRSLRAGSVDLALHAIPGASPCPDDAPARQQVPVKIAFRVTDVDARRAELEAAGVRVGTVQRFDGLVFCDCVDPEGNIFQLSNRP